MQTVFAGKTYVWTRESGTTSVIQFRTEDTTKQTITADWTTTINDIRVTVPASGLYVPWTGLHNRWLFSLTGHGKSVADGVEYYSVQGLSGFGDGGTETSLPDELHVSIEWAKDGLGLQEVTDAWVDKTFELVEK